MCDISLKNSRTTQVHVNTEVHETSVFLTGGTLSPCTRTMASGYLEIKATSSIRTVKSFKVNVGITNHHHGSISLLLAHLCNSKEKINKSSVDVETCLFVVSEILDEIVPRETPKTLPN